MISTGRRLLPLATAVIPALTLTTMLASAAPASAAGASCGSRYALRSTHSIYVSSKVRGYLKVYYNSSNGYNCALAVRQGSTSLYNIKLKLCVYNATRTKYGDCRYDGYGKRNHSYAGPLYVHAPRRCLYVYAFINTNGTSKGDITGRKVHCG
ncbi:hypothetical protein GCM10023196_032360 [Actinoallomurus vinaceus]|uniref:Spore-associated protein A n=1 Tax=Actinoallomurus vinaceus TaxID=1080074 RepID=A0ABP8UBP8_9ACTN